MDFIDFPLAFFLLGLTRKGQLTCDPARLDPRPPWFLETEALLKK